MLSIRIGLRPNELGPLLDFSETSLAIILMSLGCHFHIILGEAQGSVFCKERAVASVQNVELRKSQLRIPINVVGAVFMTDERRHDRCSMGRIFAVEDQGRIGLGRAKEIVCQSLFVVVIDSSFNVSTLVFIFKATVDDHNLLESVVVFATQDINHDALIYPRQAVCLIFGNEMWQLQLVGFIHEP